VDPSRPPREREERDEPDDGPIDPDLGYQPPAKAGPDPRLLAVIAAGGAIGGPARYAVSELIPVAAGGFPWATLWTNLSGSFALGLLVVVLARHFRPSRSRYLRAFLGTGFCGAYTTYSTFAVETDLLVRDGHTATAATYVVVSIVIGLAAVYLGMTVGRWLPKPTPEPAP
jgi:CrcB protein